MIGATLSVFILAGVLSAFLFIGRSGANLRNYNDIETQGRKSLEVFAEDTRQASAVSWASATSVTLTVNTNSVTYSCASGVFTRVVVTPSATTTTTTLLTAVTAFNLLAYDLSGAAITDFSTAGARTTANASTKQVGISLSAARSTTTVTTATSIVLSARYVLRNKRVV